MTPGGERAGTADPATGPWTVLRVIRTGAEWLQERGVESPRLDTEHLLAHALGTDRLQLYLQYDRPLTPDELGGFRPLLRRRGSREPLQYITGRAAFRELDLRVDPRVLIPRPETEVLVQVVLDAVAGATDLTALDVGTGSGCIALSLLVEGPFRRVVGTDPSDDALAVARANAQALGSAADGFEMRRGGGFDPLSPEETFDVIVSNPPYVAAGDAPGLQPEVRDWEPAGALFAGADGLDVLNVLAASAAMHLRPGGWLAVEVGPGQASTLKARLDGSGRFASCAIHRDLSGRPRIVAARTA